jgi:hypothetical protein
MILKPTVLILGAGASQPYSYPLGGELVRQILNETNPDGGLLARVLQHRVGLRGFRERLGGSGASSIDDFLEANTGFEELGKLCTAGALTICGPGRNNQPPPNSDWYSYLWGRLHQGAATPSDFERNQLKIVTYNYEMSFERYLSRFLRNLYPDLGEPEDAANKFLERVVPTIHLHGTLGGADGLFFKQGVNRADFQNPGFLEDAARGIKIVHEDDSSVEYDTAHTWLQEAEVVQLLGFGYHPTNVRRLDLVSQSAKRKDGWQHFGGTAFLQKPAEIDRFERDMQMGRDVLRPVDSLEYLRSFARLE